MKQQTGVKKRSAVGEQQTFTKIIAGERGSLFGVLLGEALTAAGLTFLSPAPQAVLVAVGASLHDVFDGRQEPGFGFFAGFQETTMVGAAEADDLDPFDGMVFLHGMAREAAQANDAVLIFGAGHGDGVLLGGSFISVVGQDFHGSATADRIAVASLDDFQHAAAFVAAIDSELFRHEISPLVFWNNSLP